MKRSFSTLLLFIYCIIAWTVPVQAATIPAGFNAWPLQTTTDTNKVWTVKFSLPLDSSSVNSSRINITDDSNQAVKATVQQSADGASVCVDSANAYTVGGKYWLFIAAGLTASNGKITLNQPIAIPFIVSDEINKIIQITNSYSSLLTSFSVVTSPDVCTVRINSRPMLYQGNNTFSLGITGLKAGAIVSVCAYDSSGKLLENKKYTIN